MQRAETVIPIWICFLASRFALQYDTRFECANVHPRTPSEVHFMKLITKVHRTGYFGNTGFGVLKFIFERGASSFHKPRPACGSHCVYVVCVCGRAHPFYFVSLLRSSLVPSSLFEDKRERSAPRFENALHRGFIFLPSWLKAAPRAAPARELQSRILLLVYAVKQFTVAAHLRRNCGSWHRWRTF